MSEPVAAVTDARGVTRGWYVAAVVLLGAALQRNFGFYDGLGVVFVVLALGAAAAGIGGMGLQRRWGVDRILKVGLLAELLFMVVGRQGQEILLTPSLDLRPYGIGIAAITVAVLGQLLGRWRADAWGFAVVLVAVAGLGVWAIWSSPNPHIDVFVFQQQGSQALVAGMNPYQVRFPDIYGPGSPFFYGPRLSNGHETLFGFPYPPLSLFLATAGYVLGGDYRYATLAAYLLAAVLIAMIGEPRRSRPAAQLLLLVPTNLFLIEQGWSEPFAAALMATVVFVEVHRPTLTPIALGLLMVVKQYLVGVPAVAWYASAALSRRKEILLGIVIAAGVGLAVTGPLALVAPGDFAFSLIGFQLWQPFHRDALNLAGLIHAVSGWELLPRGIRGAGRRARARDARCSALGCRVRRGAGGVVPGVLPLRPMGVRELLLAGDRLPLRGDWGRPVAAQPATGVNERRGNRLSESAQLAGSQLAASRSWSVLLSGIVGIHPVCASIFAGLPVMSVLSPGRTCAASSTTEALTPAISTSMSSINRIETERPDATL